MATEQGVMDAIVEEMPKIGASCLFNRGRLRSLSSRLDVDDIAQIVAMRCIEHADRIQVDNVPAYIHVVLRNTLNTAFVRETAQRRDRRREVPTYEVNLTDATVVGWEAELEDEVRRVESALSQVCSRRACAVRLRYFEQKSNTEIAESMGVSIDAAKLLVSRGLKDVRELLGE